ncbi:hypothetical protein TNCV_694551 [Trichonephila clavipes]|nr:hypothetical protein TNCV_694551 [Trichonephila clavipes]
MQNNTSDEENDSSAENQDPAEDHQEVSVTTEPSSSRNHLRPGVFSEAVKCLRYGATGLNFSCEENCSDGAVLNLLYSVICAVIAASFVPLRSAKLKLGNPAPTK